MILASAIFFFKTNFFFQKKTFMNTIRVSNSLDPGQARLFVGPDLGPSCLQRLSADDNSRHQQTKSEAYGKMIDLIV